MTASLFIFFNLSLVKYKEKSGNTSLKYRLAKLRDSIRNVRFEFDSKVTCRFESAANVVCRHTTKLTTLAPCSTKTTFAPFVVEVYVYNSTLRV